MNEIIEVLKEELGLTKKQIKEILENEDKLGNPDIIPIIEKTIELTRQRIIEMIDKRIGELEKELPPPKRGMNFNYRYAIKKLIQELQDLKRQLKG